MDHGGAETSNVSLAYKVFTFEENKTDTLSVSIPEVCLSINIYTHHYIGCIVVFNIPLRAADISYDTNYLP